MVLVLSWPIGKEMCVCVCVVLYDGPCGTGWIMNVLTSARRKVCVTVPQAHAHVTRTGLEMLVMSPLVPTTVLGMARVILHWPSVSVT